MSRNVLAQFLKRIHADGCRCRRKSQAGGNGKRKRDHIGEPIYQSFSFASYGIVKRPLSCRPVRVRIRQHPCRNNIPRPDRGFIRPVRSFSHQPRRIMHTYRIINTIIIQVVIPAGVAQGIGRCESAHRGVVIAPAAGHPASRSAPGPCRDLPARRQRAVPPAKPMGGKKSGKLS